MNVLRYSDINMPASLVLSANAALPMAQQAMTNGLRPYQGFLTINMLLSDASSNYNALQVYLTKRRGRFTGPFSYTWSKALTEASSSGETSEDPYNRHLEKDLPPGEALIVCFRPFIEHLASTGLSANTIRRHVDNLWSIGGEIIRDLHYDLSLRKRPADQLLRSVVHEYGGPAVHNASDEQQRSVDSTSRKLHRFLTQPRP